MFKTKRREVQIHAAVTMMGDPFAINKEDQKDVEIAQFAVAFPPHLHGDILAVTVKEAFEKLGLTCLSRMRAAGLLRGGQ